MKNLPASACSAGPALERGRELTALEERLFARRQRATMALLVALSLAAPVAAFALAWGATRPEVDFRVRTFASGAKHVEAEFVGAERHGSFTEYHKGGVVKALGAYANDREDGPWEYFYFNGVRRAEGTFARGLYDGAWREWYSDGVLREERFYSRGVREGVWRSYYPNGRLEAEQPYEAGALHGEERVFYVNGQLARSVTFRHGREQGPARYFRPDGSRIAEGRFDDGEEQGLWRYFDADDAERSAATYVAGARVLHLEEAAPRERGLLGALSP